jgi:hypothetical protein
VDTPNLLRCNEKPQNPGMKWSLLSAWTDDDLRVLSDLGYEGEAATITVAFKGPRTSATPTRNNSSTAPTMRSNLGQYGLPLSIAVR